MGSTLVVSWYTGHFHRTQYFQSLFHIFYCTLNDTVLFNYLTSVTSVKWTIRIPLLLWFIYSGNIYHADCMRTLLRLPHSYSHLRHNRPIGYSELSISWFSPVSLNTGIASRLTSSRYVLIYLPFMCILPFHSKLCRSRSWYSVGI